MKCLFLICLILIQLSCAKQPGTETGNPLDQNTQQCDPAQCLPYPYVTMVAYTFAKKVDSCLNSSGADHYDEIYKSVFNQPGLDREILMSQTSFNQLQIDETDKKVNVNQSSYEICINEISHLTCDSNVFKDAYDTQKPNDYTKIHRLFRVNSVCKNIFTVKEDI